MSTSIIPPRVRDYLYPITLAAFALLGFYGILSKDSLPLWAALAAGILGLGSATVHRPSKTEAPRHAAADDQR